MLLVNIQEQHIVISSIIESKKGFNVLSSQVFSDEQSASKYLLGKKNIYIIISDIETINDEINLPTSIKKESVIKANARVSLNKRHDSEASFIIDLIKSSSKSPELKTHFFEIVDERKILTKIDWIKNKQDIKHISFPQYYYFNLCQKYFSGKTYLSVFVNQAETLFILVDNGDLIFHRFSKNLDCTNVDDISDDILKTLSYIKQQYREITLEFISIFNNSELIEDIVWNLRSIDKENDFIPFNHIDITSKQHSHTVFLEFGAFNKRKNNFLPIQIVDLHNKNKIVAYIFYFSIFYLCSGFLYFSDNYFEFKKLQQEYSQMEQQINEFKKNVPILKKDQLDSVKEEISSSFNRQGRFQAQIVNTLPFLRTYKPITVGYQKKADIGRINIYFEKTFLSLYELNSYQKQFKTDLKNIKTLDGVEIKYTFKTDYSSLVFKSNVALIENYYKEQIPEIKEENTGDIEYDN